MSDAALDLLRRTFGHPAFRGEQAQIVQHVIDGGDALVLMPTGGGKSLCYQLPALLREGCGIVVSPLIALMQDQVEALRQLGVRAAFLNSTLDAAAAAEIERALLAGELDLLYVAPERLLTAALPGLARSRVDRAVRDRRGALRLAMGPRLPPRVPRAHRAARALAGRAAHRADRDRRHADPARDRRTPGAGGRAPVRQLVRPPQHPLPRRPQGRRRAPAAGFPRRPPRRERHRLCPLAQARGQHRRAVARGRHRRPALPRRHGRRRARRQPAPLPAGGRRGDGGDDRVRHGHRQARRALRRPHRPAQVDRGLLPGDRPRRPRRRTGRGVAELRPRRRGQPAPDDQAGRRRRGAPATGAAQARRAARLLRIDRVPAAVAARLVRRSRMPAPAATATTAWSRRKAGTARRPRARRCRASTAPASASAPAT